MGERPQRRRHLVVVRVAVPTVEAGQELRSTRGRARGEERDERLARERGDVGHHDGALEEVGPTPPASGRARPRRRPSTSGRGGRAPELLDRAYERRARALRSRRAPRDRARRSTRAGRSSGCAGTSSRTNPSSPNSISAAAVGETRSPNAHIVSTFTARRPLNAAITRSSATSDSAASSSVIAPRSAYAPRMPSSPARTTKS